MMCRISSGLNDIGYSERTGENCLFKIRSDRLGHPEKGNKGQAMFHWCGCEIVWVKNKKYYYCDNCQLVILQPERLRRVDAEKRSDSLNSTNEKRSRGRSEEVSPPRNDISAS